VFSAVEGTAVGESVGELSLRGFSRPIRAFNITAIDTAGGRSASVGIERDTRADTSSASVGMARRRAEEERVDNASPSVSDEEVGGYERDARADT
jgi:hypothetical protein